MRIKAEMLPNIRKIRFYNQETREEEVMSPIYNVQVNGQGQLVFYNADQAWRGIYPADLLEINDQSAALFMTN